MTKQEYEAQIEERFLAVNQDSSASWRGRVALSEADGRPGRYYVTARNERGQTAFLLGPFTQPTLGQSGHARALGLVRKARRIVHDLNLDRSNSFSYGTAWMPLYGAAPVGKLNEHL